MQFVCVLIPFPHLDASLSFFSYTNLEILKEYSHILNHQISMRPILALLTLSIFPFLDTNKLKLDIEYIEEELTGSLAQMYSDVFEKFNRPLSSSDQSVENEGNEGGIENEKCFFLFSPSLFLLFLFWLLCVPLFILCSFFLLSLSLYATLIFWSDLFLPPFLFSFLF